MGEKRRRRLSSDVAHLPLIRSISFTNQLTTVMISFGFDFLLQKVRVGVSAPPRTKKKNEHPHPSFLRTKTKSIASK
jgi:hypothetical protein